MSEYQRMPRVLMSPNYPHADYIITGDTVILFGLAQWECEVLQVLALRHYAHGFEGGSCVQVETDARFAHDISAWALFQGEADGIDEAEAELEAEAEEIREYRARARTAG